MTRVRPSRAPRPGGREVRGRGRPALEWTKSKQRKLLRLYLCTPPTALPLARILELLKDPNFVPKERRTQKELGSLLSQPDYQSLRAKDREDMRRRLDFLRSARLHAKRRRCAGGASSPAEAPPTHARDTSAVLLPRGHCATCLNWRVGLVTAWPQPADEQWHEIAGAVSSGPWKCTNSPYDRDALRNAPTPAPTSNPPPPRPGFWRRLLGRDQSQPVSTEAPSSPRDRSSFVADISSLLSGFSLHSRSSGPPSSPRPSLSSRRTSESSRPSIPPNRGRQPSNVTEEERYSLEEYLGVQSTPETPLRFVFTKVLFDWCCRESADASIECVHARLLRAIKDSEANPTARIDFKVTPREVNSRDPAGNLLLHVAAVWGAPIWLLHFLIEHSNDASAINNRGETFLHIFHPPAEPAVSPAAIGILTRHLAMHGFDFRQVDSEGRSCLSRMVVRRHFPIEALYEFFDQISATQAEFLVNNRSFRNERLYHCVCRKLHESNMDIPTDFETHAAFRKRFRRKPPAFGELVSSATLPVALRPLGSGHLAMTDCRHAETYGAAGGAYLLPTVGTCGGSSADKTRSHAAWAESDFTSFLSHLSVGRYDINEKDRWTGGSILMSLLRGLGHEHPIDEAIETLLRKLIDASGKAAALNHKDHAGNTVLHYAAELGQPTAVRFFCLEGANVDEPNHRGHRPLHLVKLRIANGDRLRAARTACRYYECAMMLIGMGASPSTIRQRLGEQQEDEVIPEVDERGLDADGDLMQPQLMP